MSIRFIAILVVVLSGVAFLVSLAIFHLLLQKFKTNILSQTENETLYCPFCLVEGILQPLKREGCCGVYGGGPHGTQVLGLELSYSDVQFIVLNYVISSAKKKDLEIGVKLFLSGRKQHV